MQMQFYRKIDWLSVGLLTIILGLTAVFSIKFIYSFLGFDESVFVWTGFNILNGEIPYRDFLEIKPPGIFFVNALGLLLFGVNNFKLMPFLIFIPSLIGLYICLVRLGVFKLLAAILTLHYMTIVLYLPFHHTLNDVETYGLAFAVLAMVSIFLNLNNGVQLKNDFSKYLAGIFLGFSVMCKEPFVLTVIAIMGVVFVYELTIKRKQALTHLFLTIAGGITVVVVFLSYLIVNNAADAYFGTLVSEFVHSKMHSSQPATLSYAWSKLSANYYNLKVLSALVPFYIFFIFRHKLGAFSLTTIAGVILGALSITIGRNYWDHNYLMGTASLLLPAIFGGKYLSQIYFKFSKRTKILTVIVFLLFMVWPTVMLGYNFLVDVYARSYPKPVIYPDPVLSQAVQKYSTANDYILLKDNPITYVVWNRKHSNKWSTMLDSLLKLYEGESTGEKLSILRSDIETKLPKIIYLPESQIRLEQNFHMTQVLYPIINKYNYQQLHPNFYVLMNNAPRD
ncbi:hypothetical protein A2397_05080 [Candidatus Amesbacteria bacterium RIFOXYB1_FULL_44_23]|uniref:Glycosyltransferase RgtA/B/C/D-like domain-containing protein n=1 Tax=Candidatus Amesbacteria bacterium RIFOXYB1_FULL_44_23 TaxID=1797263 RepID=A0A1F4ZRR2_9BACT|nr:MAG: hypothetical protein A2397_05080 [Candidatus Amesbacteria bacterium RIFOXYB1_FULL_44_23]